MDRLRDLCSAPCTGVPLDLQTTAELARITKEERHHDASWKGWKLSRRKEKKRTSGILFNARSPEDREEPWPTFLRWSPWPNGRPVGGPSREIQAKSSSFPCRGLPIVDGGFDRSLGCGSWHWRRTVRALSLRLPCTHSLIHSFIFTRNQVGRGNRIQNAFRRLLHLVCIFFVAMNRVRMWESSGYKQAAQRPGDEKELFGLFPCTVP